MENRNQSLKAVAYASIWPDEEAGLSLDEQSIELQAHCALQGLDLVEVFTDIGPYAKGKIRHGMGKLLERVVEGDIGHVVVFDVGRLCRESQEALSFLREAFDPSVTEVHVLAWNTSTAQPECQRMLAMTADLFLLDRQRAHSETLGRREASREQPVWKRLFGLLQDERYAEGLIKALFQIRGAKLTEKEYTAVHGGYDHLNMFKALGFRIKGEKTDNTKLVTDVLVRYWDHVKLHLHADVHKIIEGSETGAVL